MTLLDQWEIGLVPFPFTDRNATVKRAALALSVRSFNASASATILAMITKAQFSAWPGDYAIIDWKGAGLLLPSIARMKFFTLENSLILRKLGRLTATDIAGFEAAAKPILW
jgi:mRNA interferase MazF